MSFEFSLKSLLRVRRGFEKRERLHLAILMQELKKQQLEMTALDCRIAEHARSTEATLAHGVISDDHQLSENELESLKGSRASLDEHFQEIERHRQTQQSRLIIARQGRRILESIQASKLEAYRKEEARRDQQRQDDQFNALRDRSELLE